MMQPVPYTRDAIRLIRNGASAADLGWPASMYERVCRSHGIEQAKPRREVVRQQEDDLRPEPLLQFRPRSSEIIRAGIIIAVSPVQGEAFGILYNRYIAGEQNFISAFDISGKLKKECSTRNVVNMLYRMNRRLAPLKCWIEAKVGKDGGYRLRVEP
jgi:hypothetical protein